MVVDPSHAFIPPVIRIHTPYYQEGKCPRDTWSTSFWSNGHIEEKEDRVTEIIRMTVFEEQSLDLLRTVEHSEGNFF